MRQIDTLNEWPFVVSKNSPVLAPTVKPENAIVPAVVLLVISTMQEPSLAGAAKVEAPPSVMYCSGDFPQSIVVVPPVTMPILCDATLAPPVSVWSVASSDAAPGGTPVEA